MIEGALQAAAEGAALAIKGVAVLLVASGAARRDRGDSHLLELLSGKGSRNIRARGRRGYALEPVENQLTIRSAS
jgi:hypothetical protein